MNTPTEPEALAIKAVTDLRDGIGTEMQRDRDMRHILGLAIDRIRAGLSTPAARMLAGEGEAVAERMEAGLPDGCPSCGALPCDWTDDPFNATVTTARAKYGEIWPDLLTKAIGDITAALILAGEQEKIHKWTAPYVVAINQFDAGNVFDERHCEKCDDSGYVHENGRQEYCECACGHDAMDQDEGKGLHAPPAAEPVGLREVDVDAIARKWLPDMETPSLDARYVSLKAAITEALATPARTDDAGVGGAEDVGLRIAERIRQELTSGGQWSLGSMDDAQREEFEAEIASACVAVCEQEFAALSPAPDRGELEDDEGPCTDCDDSGITIQTERRCACQPPLERPRDEKSALAELIRTRLFSVDPDDQDLQLEDDDWRIILAALKPADATPAGEAVQMARELWWPHHSSRTKQAALADLDGGSDGAISIEFEDVLNMVRYVQQGGSGE